MKRTAVAVLAVSAVAFYGAPAATAAPTQTTVAAGQADRASRAVIRAFYKQTSPTQRTLCASWRTDPVRLGRKLTRTLTRAGYTSRAASRGVVLGMVTVCGKPHGYSGVTR